MKTLLIQKNIFRFIVIGMLLLNSAWAVSAHNLPDFHIVNAGLGKQFGVSVAGLMSDGATFELRTVQGEVLLYQSIKATAFNKLYSLESLQEGQYILTLRTLQQSIIQPVRLTRRALLYDLSERRIVFTPAVELDGRQLDIDYHNPAQAAFSIQLRNEEGEVLYEQSFENLTEIEQRINLLNLPAGGYLLNMKAPDRSWQQDLVLH